MNIEDADTVKTARPRVAGPVAADPDSTETVQIDRRTLGFLDSDPAFGTMDPPEDRVERSRLPDLRQSVVLVAAGFVIGSLLLWLFA